jgi:hypothetical protein
MGDFRRQTQQQQEEKWSHVSKPRSRALLQAKAAS